jgi:hypothetical protein
LAKHSLSSEGTKVRVTADKLKNPARMDNFHVDVEIPATLNERHQHGIQEAVRHCLIHATLAQSSKIFFQIAGAPAEISIEK